MSTDSVAADMPLLPPQDEALALLMASPDFQALMATLTQQGAAQLQALVESLRALEGQLAPPPPSAPPPSGFEDDILPGIWPLPPEPVLLPPALPERKPAVTEGIDLLMPSDVVPLARMAVMPDAPALERWDVAPHEVAVDMLAVLPVVAAHVPDQAGAAGSAPDAPGFVDWCWSNAGEGGVF